MPIDKDKVASEKWYTRPIFSVSNIEMALLHYCDSLGFEQAWKYEEEERTIVTQVNKGEFELILAANLDRVGEGRVFVSLSATELEKLENNIEQKQIATKNIQWGYPTIQIKDPDGNEMLFPLEIEG